MPFDRFSDDELAPSSRRQRHGVPSRSLHNGRTHGFGLSQSNNPTTFSFQSKNITHSARTSQGDGNLRSSSAVAASYNSDTMTFYRHRHMGNQSNLPSQSQSPYSRRDNSATIQHRTTGQWQAPLTVTDRYPTSIPSLVSRQDWTNFVNMKAKPSSGTPSASIRNDGASAAVDKIESHARVNQTAPKPIPAKVKVAESRPPLQILLDLNDTSHTKDPPATFLPAALNDLMGLDFSLCQDGEENLLDKEMMPLGISGSVAPNGKTALGSSLSCGPGDNNTSTTATNSNSKDIKEDYTDNRSSSSSSSNNNSNNDNDYSDEQTDVEQNIISLQKLEDLRDNLRMRCLGWSDLLEKVKL